MSAQTWFLGFEILSGIATALVIVGLFKEYGLDVLKAFKFWGARDTRAHIEIETASKRQGSALVVLGIAIELVGTVGIVVTSRTIDTQHRGEIATLNRTIEKERSRTTAFMEAASAYRENRHVLEVWTTGGPEILGYISAVGRPIRIQSMQYDNEANELGCELEAALNEAQFGMPHRMSTSGSGGVPNFLIQSGVTIYCDGCSNGKDAAANQLKAFLTTPPNAIATRVLSPEKTNWSLADLKRTNGIAVLIGEHSLTEDANLFEATPNLLKALADNRNELLGAKSGVQVRGYAEKCQSYPH